MQICVINLGASRERRRNIEAQFAPLGIDYSFFDAIDADRGFDFFPTYDERQFLLNTGRGASAGEVACYASHLSLWRRSVATNEAVLIMEDDARIESNFVAAVAFVERRILHYGFIRLQSDGLDRKGRKCRRVAVERADGFTVHYYRRSHFGAMCYAVSPEVARQFVTMSRRLTGPVDLFIKKFWLHERPLFGLSPPPVTPSALSACSTIAERDKEKPGLALRLARARRKLDDAVARARFNRNYAAALDDAGMRPVLIDRWSSR